MQTLIVEVKNNIGLKILQDLEQASIIKLVTNEKNNVKLSSRLRGSISKDTAKKMNSELEQMRNEWQRKNT